MMAEQLKNIYNKNFFEQYCNTLKEAIHTFDHQLFIKSALSPEWELLELKQRMNHLSEITDAFLPQRFEDKVNTIFKIIDKLIQSGVKNQNLEYIFLTDIITKYGLQDFENSIFAIEKITQFTSFEFAGRPYFIHYPEKMMNQMMIWANHKNENVRRFASEGCRPRLPWGLQLKQFILEPKPIVRLLEKLKDDQSEYVRKSVANNLNDISKDHPELIFELLSKWKGKSKNTDWIIRHAARTLLKKGHTETLKLFGNSSEADFKLTDFRVDKKTLKHNEALYFEFKLTNHEEVTLRFRIEYLIYYMKSNGMLAKKIFKISEPEVGSKQSIQINKMHKFIDLTTRKHYEGKHKISIVVNGIEFDKVDFYLHT